MKHIYLAFKMAIPVLIGMTVSQNIFAQSEQDRANIRSSYQEKLVKKGKAIDHFKKELEKAQLETLEASKRVDAYLQKHPGKLRNYTKNGKPYFIQDIRPDGSPIIITIKDKQAADSMKASSMYPGGSIGVNITGQNMIVGVWDIGPLRATHELFQGRAIQKDTATGDGSHMDHVTGDLIGGDISSNRAARGVAYNATAWCFNAKIDKPGYTKFGSDGYLVSNHSYGRTNKDSTEDPIWSFGAYDREAREIDEILVSRPNYLQIWAAGNEQKDNANFSRKQGYDVMTGASATKNTLQVGALNADNTMSDYSNWGPTDDGRIKPDICAKGTDMVSAASTSDNSYDTGNGTSYAAPSISGLAILLQQYYRTLNPAYMDAAGLRGLMLHTATDLGQPGPDYKFGWGLANGENAAKAIKNANADLTQFNSESKIATVSSNPPVGSSQVYSIRAKGTSPLMVSISWTDDAGPEQTSDDGIDPTKSRLVYNFDITVTGPNGTVFYPWSGPGMANRTQNSTRTGANNVDNFERVDIDNPVADGLYVITITKSSNSPAAARDFTIIATGLQNAQLLPIHLVKFSGGAQKEGNLLQWNTLEETVGSYFELEVSTNGAIFSKLSTITARGGRDNTYSYTDVNIYSNSVYYRLKTIDVDGKVNYSSIISINKKDMQPSFTLFPSPAHNLLNIQSAISLLNTKGSLFDSYGRLLQTFTINKTSQQLDISRLSAGTYSIKLVTGKTIQFIKQ